MQTLIGMMPALLFLLLPVYAVSQQTCSTGIRVEGVVSDPTGAVIPGAQVRTAEGPTVVTDSTGRFVMPCISAAQKTLNVEAQGFAPLTLTLQQDPGQTAHLKLQLQIAAVNTDVRVGDDATSMDADHGAGTSTLNTADVQQLADDPDDFVRELQALADTVGGGVGTATITVDGFQNPSAMPPKGAIGSIRINPDIFNPEYQWAPYRGGLIEIFTKPGADSFHGALFFTDSDGSFNATDPFSVTATPAGKRRYGFELTGPLLRKKSDFALALERREIDEFNVVNAVSLDANYNQTPVQETVAAPQRLWIGSGRSGWQLSQNDLATLSFSANVNDLENQGVGGLTLPDAGYSSLVSEYDLRFNNTLTIGPNILHETRIGYSWKRTNQSPLSTAPSLEVSGYFLGGGATSQALNDRERDLEIDDDLMLTHKKHTWKFGVQSLGVFVHDYDPNTFNGAYVFGGGSAPVLDSNNMPTGETETISPIEQYRRALQNLPGGTPTTYQIATGTPLVPFTQWEVAVYGQDTIKVTPNLTVSAGLRYQLQTTPSSFANFAPRLGLAWSPDKQKRWVIHLRAGLFRDPNPASYVSDVYRLNGIRQKELTVYSPNLNNPLASSPGAITINNLYQFQSGFFQKPSLQAHLSIERDLPHHWHPSATVFWGEDWGRVRIRNINAPMVADSIGVAPDPTTALLAPRPIAPNENIMEYQNSGHLAGTLLILSLSQQSYKRFGFSFNYKYENVKSDGGDNPDSPQSSYSDRGESSRVDWDKPNNFTFIGNAKLPYKVTLSTIFDSHSGVPYNITTGTDANGDGNFDDRPSFATTPGSGIYSTKYGLMTTNAVNGNVPRNLGTMPGLIHLDANLSRIFTLNPKDKNHPRTLTFTARSANLLNHTNVTAVNSILSSGSLGQNLSAEAARRLELGVRFSF